MTVGAVPARSRSANIPSSARDVRRRRVGIGVIFQQFNLVSRLTLITNVMLGALGRVPPWRGSLCNSNMTDRGEGYGSPRAQIAHRHVALEQVEQRAQRLAALCFQLRVALQH